MSLDDIKLKIHIAFANMGLFIDSDDTPLEEIIVDSLEFVSLIIEIESVLDFEFPDELLSLDKIGTINTLSIALNEIIN